MVVSLDYSETVRTLNTNATASWFGLYAKYYGRKEVRENAREEVCSKLGESLNTCNILFMNETWREERLEYDIVVWVRLENVKRLDNVRDAGMVILKLALNSLTYEDAVWF